MLKKIAAYALLLLAALAGQTSLILLGVFLYFGGLDIVMLNFGDMGALLLDAGLCLVFFAQHSLMVRKRYRKWLAAHVRMEFHAALYTIASAMALILLVTVWQKSSVIMMWSEGAGFWLFRGAYFLSIAGLVWGNLALGSFDSFGLNSVLAYVRGATAKPLPFAAKGPYRWVRHPLYFCSLLMIWSCPTITVDRLLFNALFTIWILIGMRFEERDLMASYGAAYETYQKQVPMILPRGIQPALPRSGLVQE